MHQSSPDRGRHIPLSGLRTQSIGLLRSGYTHTCNRATWHWHLATGHWLGSGGNMCATHVCATYNTTCGLASCNQHRFMHAALMCALSPWLNERRTQRSEAKRNERARNRNKTQKSLVSLALPGSLTPRAPSPLTGSLTPQAPSLLMAPHPSGSLPAHRLRAISLRALSPLLGVSPSGHPPCSWVSLPHGSLPTHGSLTPLPPPMQAEVALLQRKPQGSGRVGWEM